MYTFKGYTANVERPIIGRVSFSPVTKKSRPYTILVMQSPSPSGGYKEYAGLVTCSNTGVNVDTPLVYLPDGLSLQEGDIIEVLPNGAIILLYQKQSEHNIIFATSRCNSMCIMCPQPMNNSEKNMTEHNLRLITLIDRSTKELAITGGEPTLIGEDLFRLILACKNFLPNTSLLLLTNGRKFVNYEYARFFCSLKHRDIIVGTPIYGDNDVDHDIVVGSTGAFNETIRGILNLATFNMPIEIRTVIHRYTYKNLPRIAEFAYRNLTFSKHIALMGLESVWLAKKNIKQLFIKPSELLVPLMETVQYLVQRDMNISIYNIPLCLLPENLWSYCRQSISEWKRRYYSECVNCLKKGECSGMFESAAGLYVDYYKPIR